MAEESKVSLRNARRDAMDTVKNLKKDNLISEDDQAGAEKEIQKIIDSYNANIEKLLDAKEKEVMEV